MKSPSPTGIRTLIILGLCLHYLLILKSDTGHFSMALLMPNLQEPSFLRSLINLIYNFVLFIFLAVLGLHCGMAFSQVAGSGGCSPVSVLGSLDAVDSLAVEHGL